MNIPQTSFPRIVIIGGGFAGLAAAKGLEKQELQVVLIDQQLPYISTPSLSSCHWRTRTRFYCFPFKKTL